MCYLHVCLTLTASASRRDDDVSDYIVATAAVFQSREDLEQQSIETADTSEAVTFITFVQSLRRQMKPWEKQVEVRFVVHIS